MEVVGSIPIISKFFFRSQVKTYKLQRSAPSSDLKSFKIDYEGELNAQQFQAVKHPSGPALVIAGAGTGKTRVLTFRSSFLIESGVPPEQILLLTFSRKSAAEMKRRAAHLLDARGEKIAGGTFHGYAHILLRRYAEALGYANNFTIIDRSDAEDAVHLLRNKLGFGEGNKRFPNKKTILNVISQSLNTGKKFRKILAEDYPQHLECEDDLVVISRFYEEYKKRKQLFDYDDLLLKLRDLLKLPELGETIAKQTSQILVDEYQDTNHLQLEILQLLAKPHGNIMAVGDDFQSIYAFRGANFKNIISFEQHFPSASVYKIEENYRSTNTILSFTNDIISSAKEKYEKKLFSNILSEQKPVLLEPSNEPMQSAFVTQRILELQEEGILLKKMAVLFRSGAHSNDLEVALNSARIPYRKFGGFKFTESSHVKDILAHLRVYHNAADAPAWNRILLLQEGIGPGTAGKLIEKIVDQGLGLSGLEAPEFKDKKYSLGLAALKKAIEAVGAQENVAEMVESIFVFAEPILKNHYDDFKKRRDDLESLVKIATRYDTLSELLSDLTLDPPETEADLAVTDKEEDYLTLSTIHSAKGLEWQVVFVLALAEGYFPSSYSVADEESLEEERRLFYVAATRAEKWLYLMATHLEPLQTYYNNAVFLSPGPSRFLKEMPHLAEVVEAWQIE